MHPSWMLSWWLLPIALCYYYLVSIIPIQWYSSVYVCMFISQLAQRSKDFLCILAVYTPHRGDDIIWSQVKYRLLHTRECDIRYTRTEPSGLRLSGSVRACTSGDVITCLSLLKPYCACTQHAIAQCYCIISKSPRGWSKPQSTLRADIPCRLLTLHMIDITQYCREKVQYSVENIYNNIYIHTTIQQNINCE